MKHTMISALAALVLAATAGCSKKADAPPAPTPVTASPDGSGMKHGEHEHGGGGGDEMAMPPELAKFHDIIKPLWHADLGDKRMTDTCAAVPQINAQANAVALDANMPKGADAGKWAAAAKELVDASIALKDPCDKKDAVAFEPAFKRVHEGFHAALSASGTPHEEHEHHDGPK